MINNNDDQLEKVYKVNLPIWQRLLTEITGHISSKIGTKETKFFLKSRVKSLESLYAKRRLVLDLENKENQEQLKSI